jgi:hypothetical protein
MNALKRLSSGPRLLSALFLLPVSAYATPVTWTLQGIAFADGGTASGSFVFNASIDAYGSINIVTTAGSKLSGATYAFLDPAQIQFEGPTELTVVTLEHRQFVRVARFGFFRGAALTDAGGTVEFSTSRNSAEGSCTSATCSSADQNPSDYRFISGGSITSVTTPEPSTHVLLGYALGVLGLRRLTIAFWKCRYDVVCLFKRRIFHLLRI